MQQAKFKIRKEEYDEIAEEYAMITIRIKDVDLRLETEPSLFSPNFIDRGTLAMLSVIDFHPEDKVLDLGCGYGVVGILAGKLIGEENVVMCDISNRAAACARRNTHLNGVPNIKICSSDGYENIEDENFTLILSNPPYHTDFSIPKKFIEGGYRRLAMGGKMVMVTKRKIWYKNKLTSVFGGVKVYEREGYFIFVAEKRSGARKKSKKSGKTISKKLQRKAAARH